MDTNLPATIANLPSSQSASSLGGAARRSSFSAFKSQETTSVGFFVLSWRHFCT